MDGSGVTQGGRQGLPPAEAPAPRGGTPPRRLLALRIAAILLPALALAAMALVSWHTVQAEAKARVDRATDMLREHALRALEAQDIVLAAVETRIQDMTWPTIRDSAELNAFLRGIDTLTQSAAGIGLTDPAGWLANSSSSNFPVPAVDLSRRDYVAALPPGSGAREYPFIGEAILARPSGRAIFPMARPRRGRDGTGDGGVIMVQLWPSYFQGFYRSIAETPEDSFQLFRLDGAVLAAVPPPAVAEGAALRPAAGAILRELRRSPGISHAGPSPFDDVPRITALRRVGGYSVAVAYGLPMAAVREAWLARMAGPAAGAALAMLLLTALTLQAERAQRARAAAEARSRAAERQATLGLLAGGLAHDFGNITQSVLAAARLLGRHAEDAARVREVAQLLNRHAERGTSLVRRMLDTTRRSGSAEAGTATPVDAGAALRDLALLLDATLAPGMQVRAETSGDLRLAPGIDRVGLETAIINLAANARDAMPQGGEVRITAGTVQVAAPHAGRLGVLPGNYVRITVADRGIGMSSATLARLGEPFFTTKAPQEGTGLGLAMVAAFLRACGGGFAAESTPGQGSTVSLYLPAAKQG
jgi:signal transduction histidine kinase